MTVPEIFENLPLPVKLNLTSYHVWLDCSLAVQRLQNKNLSYFEWKVEWAGICALLRTAIYLLGVKDAKSCLPENLRAQLKSDWDELYKHKQAYPLFSEFILKERNNILKQYEFSTYEAVLKPDGTVKPRLGLLDLMEEGEKRTMLIRGGYYDGRQALEVLTEAVEWVKSYICGSIEKAGYDPDEKRYAGTLLSIKSFERPKRSLASLLVGDRDESLTNEAGK